MVSGSWAQRAWRLQADREAKYDNPYGRNHPMEQTSQHAQDGAGMASSGEDMSSDDNIPMPLDPTDLDDAPQREEHDDMEKLLQEATLDLGDQQQQHLQQQDQQRHQELVSDT